MPRRKVQVMLRQVALLPAWSCRRVTKEPAGQARRSSCSLAFHPIPWPHSVAVMRTPHSRQHEASTDDGFLAGINRRIFLKGAALGAASLAGGHSLDFFARVAAKKEGVNRASGYKYRIAF